MSAIISSSVLTQTVYCVLSVSCTCRVGRSAPGNLFLQHNPPAMSRERSRSPRRSSPSNINAKFSKPLVFLDLETTGGHPFRDRIVQLAFFRAEFFSTSEVDQGVGAPPGQWFGGLVHPGIPIPSDKTKIHGIGDQHVANCGKFGQYADAALDFLKGCDLVGWNLNNFDLKILAKECERCGRGAKAVEVLEACRSLDLKKLCRGG